MMSTDIKWREKVEESLRLEARRERDSEAGGQSEAALLHNYAASMMAGLLEWDDLNAEPVPVDEIAGLYADQVRNTAPEDKWLEVHQAVVAATRWLQKEKVDEIVRLDETIGQLIDAVWGLVLLLEPPSVRERRLREVAQVHRGEVVPGSGKTVEPRDFQTKTGNTLSD